MNSIPLKKEFPVLFAILLVIIILAYANTLHAPFQFDDVKIESDLEIRDLGNFMSISTLRHRHVHSATLALNYELAGLNPFGYHIFNLFLHSYVALLVFHISFLTAEKGMLLRRKTAIRVAFVVALLFALNPTLSEAVTYISGRPSSLATFFYLISLYCFILASLKKPLLALPRFLMFLFSLIACFVAVLSKEIAMTLPLMAVLYDVCFMRTEHWVTWRSRLFGFYLLFPGLMLIFVLNATRSVSVFRWWLGQVDYVYALAQIKVITHAVILFFLPINLTSEYSSYYEFNATDPVFILSAVFWFGVLLVSTKIMRKTAVLFFAALWFLIAISPTNSIIPREDMFSERNLYLPAFGLVLLFSTLFNLIFKPRVERIHVLSPNNSLGSSIGTRPDAVIYFVFGLMVILTAYSALLIKRNLVYRDTLIYWEDTYKKTPKKLRVLHNLSLEYLKQENREKTFAILKRMLEINPANYFARINLARIYIQQGKPDIAEKEYLDLIKTNPEKFEPYFNLGSFYADRRDFDNARKFYEKAEKAPDAQQHPALYLYRGKIYYELGLLGYARNDWERCFLMLEKSKEEFPQQDIIHNLLGLVYINQNDPQKAIIEFEKAIKINPRFIEWHFNLGRLLLDWKIDFIKAKHHFKEVLAMTTDPQKIEDVAEWIKQAEINERIKQAEISLARKQGVSDEIIKIKELELARKKSQENALQYYKQALAITTDPARKKELEMMIASQTVIDQVDMGKEQAGKGNHRRAMSHFENALSLNNDPQLSKEIKSLLVPMYYKWGERLLDEEMDLDKALVYFKKALALDPNPQRAKEIEALASPDSRQVFAEAKLDKAQDKIMRKAFHSAIDEGKAKLGMSVSMLDDFKSPRGVDNKASQNHVFNARYGFYRPISIHPVYGTNTLIGGTVSAIGSYGEYYPSLAVDGRIDTQWVMNISKDVWISYDYGVGSKRFPAKLRFCMGSEGVPKEWIFQGSNDNVIWTDLLQGHTNQYSFSEPLGYECHEAVFSNSTAYRYIRFWVKESWKGNTGLYEWEVFEEISSSSQNMILVSTNIPVMVAPPEARFVMYGDYESSVSPNTDFKAYVTRDNGATWTQVDLEDNGKGNSSRRILSGHVVFSGQSSGKSLRWKVETLNNKKLKLYGIALQWK